MKQPTIHFSELNKPTKLSLMIITIVSSRKEKIVQALVITNNCNDG